jgi:hypothetical protein
MYLQTTDDPMKLAIDINFALKRGKNVESDLRRISNGIFTSKKCHEYLII